MDIRPGDYVASDDNEATMTVLRVEEGLALCQWFVDGDVDGDLREEWVAVSGLTVL